MCSNWSWNPKKRNFTNQVKLKRASEKELNQAISDLEKRGYVLVDRGIDERRVKNFQYRNNHGPKYKFSGDENYATHWAVMKGRDIA